MKTKEPPLSILVVEDNPADFFLIESMLMSSAIKVKDIHQASRISEACSILQTQAIGLIILDLSLPDSFGIDSFLQIKPIAGHIPVIILTGLSESIAAAEALQQGAQDYLVKGEFKADLLARSIKYSIDRKSAEEKIILSEEKYRQIFYKNPFPAWIYDLESLRILEVNDAAIRVYGYSREEFLELTNENINLDKNITLKQVGKNLSSQQQDLGGLCRHKRKNGEIIMAEIACYEVNYSGKTARQVIINDITEKLRLEKELRRQQTLKQQQITLAVFNAQEKERKGIGEELHDNINQILAASRLYLDCAVAQPEERVGLIRRGITNVSLAIEEIRKLSQALIIPAFIQSEFRQSIEDLAVHIRVAKKFNITLDTIGMDETNLCESLKITIYRIIQEQINNILKYAEASEVMIRIASAADTVLLTISDNGKGFDPLALRKGVGITNINSRAELFNGKVEIESSPGNGCRLKVKLNIKVAATQKAA